MTNKKIALNTVTSGVCRVDGMLYYYSYNLYKASGFDAALNRFFNFSVMHSALRHNM